MASSHLDAEYTANLSQFGALTNFGEDDALEGGGDEDPATAHLTQLHHGEAHGFDAGGLLANQVDGDEAPATYEELLMLGTITALANRAKKQTRLSDTDGAALGNNRKEKTLYHKMMMAWMIKRKSICTRIRTRPQPMTTRDAAGNVTEHLPPPSKVKYLTFVPVWKFPPPYRRELNLTLGKVFNNTGQLFTRHVVQHFMDLTALIRTETPFRITLADFFARVVYDALVEELGVLSVSFEVEDTNPNDSLVLVQVHQHDALPDDLAARARALSMEVAGNGGGGGGGDEDDNDASLGPPNTKRRKLVETHSENGIGAFTQEALRTFRETYRKLTPASAVAVKQQSPAEGGNGGGGGPPGRFVPNANVMQQAAAFNIAQNAVIMVNAAHRANTEQQIRDNHLSDAITGAGEFQLMVDFYTKIDNWEPNKLPIPVERLRVSNMGDPDYGYSRLTPVALLTHKRILQAMNDMTKPDVFRYLLQLIERKYRLKAGQIESLSEGVIQHTDVAVDVGHVYVDDLEGAGVAEDGVTLDKTSSFWPIVDMVTNFSVLSDANADITNRIKFAKSQEEWDPFNILNGDDYEQKVKQKLQGEGEGDAAEATAAAATPNISVEQLMQSQHNADWVKQAKKRFEKEMLTSEHAVPSDDGVQRSITVPILTGTSGESYLDVGMSALTRATKVSDHILWKAISLGVHTQMTRLLDHLGRDPDTPVNDMTIESAMEIIDALVAISGDARDSTLLMICKMHFEEVNRKSRGKLVIKDPGMTKRKLTMITPLAAAVHLAAAAGGGGGAAPAVQAPQQLFNVQQ